MKKILIVDDDDLFRSKLREFLLAEDRGLFLLEEAPDGQKALRLIEKEIPDVVLTDIDMPGINGVELIRFIKENYPSVAIIALSAYDDYKYVRNSLKLGAKDYLLKHMVTPESLLRLLKEAVDLPEPPEDGNQRRLSRAEMLKQLLQSKAEEDDGSDRLRKYHLSEDGGVICASFLCRLKKSVSENAKTHDPRFLAQSVDHVIKGVLSFYPFADLIRFNDEEALLFFDLKDSVSRKAMRIEIEKCLALLRHKINLLLNANIFFGVSREFSGPKKYTAARSESSNALRMRFFSPDDTVYYQSSPPSDIPIIPDMDVLSNLSECLRVKNTERAIGIINGFFDEIQKKKPPYFRIQIFCHLLLQTIEETLEKERPYEIHSLPFAGEESETDLTAIRQWFCMAAEQAASAQEDIAYSPATKAALAFIQSHYSENISLKDAAKGIGFNPSYLSRVFREDTGVPFTSFLNSFRIQKVLSVLKKNPENNSLAAISQQVGFGSYNHFWDVFKRLTGFTPEIYIKNSKNSEAQSKN